MLAFTICANTIIACGFIHYLIGCSVLRILVKYDRTALWPADNQSLFFVDEKKTEWTTNVCWQSFCRTQFKHRHYFRIFFKPPDCFVMHMNAIQAVENWHINRFLSSSGAHTALRQPPVECQSSIWPTILHSYMCTKCEQFCGLIAQSD